MTDRILKLLQEFDAFAVMLFDDIMTGTFGRSGAIRLDDSSPPRLRVLTPPCWYIAPMASARLVRLVQRKARRLDRLKLNRAGAFCDLADDYGAAGAAKKGQCS